MICLQSSLVENRIISPLTILGEFVILQDLKFRRIQKVIFKIHAPEPFKQSKTEKSSRLFGKKTVKIVTLMKDSIAIMKKLKLSLINLNR